MPVAFPQSNINEGIFENRKGKGYYNTTQIALLMGFRNLSEQYNNSRTEFQNSPSLTMTNGYIFNKHWAAGIGVGFEMFDRNLFPVFIDIRRTMLDNKISLFFAFKMGYSISDVRKKHYDNLSLDHSPYYANNVYYKKSGGLMLHPEMGIKIPKSDKADLLFTVAYRYQRTKSTVSQDFGQRYKWEHKVGMNRLSFGVAVMFR